MKLRSITLASLVLMGMTACGRSQQAAPSDQSATAEAGASDVFTQPVIYDNATAGIAAGVIVRDGIPDDSQWVRIGGDGNGALSYGFICDDKPVGFWTYYHDNGVIAMQGKYLYGGTKDGEWRVWHRNGRLHAEGSFDRGERIGEWAQWHENGRRSTRGAYLNGERRPLGSLVSQWRPQKPWGLREGQPIGALGLLERLRCLAAESYLYASGRCLSD